MTAPSTDSGAAENAYENYLSETYGPWDWLDDQDDREPQPGDGPEYHSDHAAWRARQNDGSGVQP